MMRGRESGKQGGDGGHAARPAGSGRSLRLVGWRRRAFFVGFTIVVGAALLGMIEGVSRLAGYGGYEPTFQRFGRLADGSELVITDFRGPSSYFFADRSRPGSLDRAALRMPKPPGTFRVVIVGESAAKGFPYPRNLASSAFLEEMLSDLMTGRRVEVINLGTTAVASYPVLGMLKEALEHEVDLAVIYCGNNEFFGAYGVASLHSAGRTPALIRATRAARGLGITQFIEAKWSKPLPAEDRTLMETMMGRSRIGASDPMREAAARNLGVFVGEMIERCRSAGVPVIVCTPPGNERGLAPLGEEILDGISPADRVRLAELEAAARAGLGAEGETRSAGLEAARLAAGEMLTIAPQHALAHFLLATALDAEGREAEAAPAFRRALDLDTMPWRAPSESVEAIRGAARRHGAVLCDLVEIFRSESPGGIIGWELMDDHVHPNLRGQDLIARSIAAKAPDAVGSVGFSRGRVAALEGMDAYAARLGATEYDLYAAAHGMRVLGSIPFFVRSNPHFVEMFDGLCREIESASPPWVASALRAWQTAPAESGEMPPITGRVAMALFDRGLYAEAEPLFFAAAMAAPPYGSWELQQVVFALSCRGEVRGGLDASDRALALEMIGRGRFLIENGYSRSGSVERFVGELHLLRDEAEAAVGLLLLARAKMTGDEVVAVDGVLVEAYRRLGRRAEAEAVVRRGLEAGGSNARYYEQMRATLP